MKRLLIPFILLILTSCQTTDGLATQNNSRRHINELSSLYDMYELPYSKQGTKLIVEYTPYNMEKVLKIYNLLYFQMDIISDNIVNVNTTRTISGSYYRKQIVVIDEYGEFYSREIESPPRVVYDPAHPDSKTTGDMAGYVEFPNINLENEMEELVEISKLFDIHSDIFISLDSDLMNRVIMQQLGDTRAEIQALIDDYYNSDGEK